MSGNHVSATSSLFVVLPCKYVQYIGVGSTWTMEDPIASTSTSAVALAAPEDASGEADKEPVQQNEGAEWTAAAPAPAAAAANRVAVTAQELAEMDANTIRKIWTEQDRYVDQLEAKCREAEAAAVAAATSSDLQQQQQQQQKRQDVSRREHLLVMRLSTKEQELQELSAQIGELKSAQVPTASQLRATLVDPGVNIIIQKLKASMPKLLLMQTLK